MASRMVRCSTTFVIDSPALTKIPADLALNPVDDRSQQQSTQGRYFRDGKRKLCYKLYFLELD